MLTCALYIYVLIPNVIEIIMLNHFNFNFNKRSTIVVLATSRMTSFYIDGITRHLRLELQNIKVSTINLVPT